MGLLCTCLVGIVCAPYCFLSVSCLNVNGKDRPDMYLSLFRKAYGINVKNDILKQYIASRGSRLHFSALTVLRYDEHLFGGY